MLGPFTQPPDEFSGSVLALMGGGGLEPGELGVRGEVWRGIAGGIVDRDQHVGDS
jgi:hypothetical protein